MGMFRRFEADQSGATAIIFGLALVPLVGFAGGALDYSRAARVQTDMQLAADMTAVALVRQPATMSDGDLQSKGRQLFLNAFRSGADVALAPVTITRTGNTYRVAAAGQVTNAMMQIFGYQTTAVSADAVSTKGSQQIELALVLDNTGSMGDAISGQRKIDALKDNATKLLASLRAAATDTNSVKVSVVPFDTEVRLDATNGTKPWFHFLSGASSRNWTGYVFDRYNDYAMSDAPPTLSAPDSLFPAPRDTEYHTNSLLERESTRDLATMKPLTSVYNYGDYTALNQMVGAMQPRGYTNIALGVMWGLATLSPSEPFTDASYSASAKKFMVVLTDGNNTMNHVNGSLKTNVSQIDQNTRTACTATKSAGVEVFTIRLLDGDKSLLSNCASGSDHYFDAQNAKDLADAFLRITNAITGTRLTN